MSNLERRIERLEEKLKPRRGPRLIYIHPNLGEGEEETPYQIKVSAILGGGFNDGGKAHAKRGTTGGDYNNRTVRRRRRPIQRGGRT